MKTTCLALAILFKITFAQAAGATKIDRWLTAGPLAIPPQVFADTAFKIVDLADKVEWDMHNFRPEVGQRLEWSSTENALWEAQNRDSLKFKIGGPYPYAIYAATYIESARRQEVKLAVKSGRACAAWLDGESVGKATSAKDKLYELSGTLDLHTGKHLLLLKFVSEESLSPQEWGVSAALVPDSATGGVVNLSLDATRRMANFSDWGLFHELSSPAVSSDGKYAAVIHSSRDKKYKKTGWIEIYRISPPELVATLRPSGPSSLFFFPQSPILGYTVSGDEGSTVWGYHLETHETRPYLSNVKGLEKVVCSPDEKYLYYTQSEEEPENKTGYKLLDEIVDRVYDFDRRISLMEYTIRSGVARPVTDTGNFHLTGFAVSKEGDKLAFTRYVPRTGRPYTDTELWVYDLSTRKGERVLSRAYTETIRNLCWLPGGGKLVFSAAGFESQPSDTVFHNVNQGRVYLFDPATKQLEPLSAGEDFSVVESESRAHLWCTPRGGLWVSADYHGGIRLFSRPDAGGWSELKTGRSVIDSPVMSVDGSVFVYAATSPTAPVALFAYDTRSRRETMLLDPNRDIVSQFKISRYEDWEFTNGNGDEIDGWLYFPDDFDPSRKYPLVVYYYGGVSPRDERFTFTYQWWCANGYVVYVLNPRGCVGYGQKFADWHSNDWGTVATQDIIEGTTKLLAEKSYLDAKRIGAYGGSYGGFITLDLATKTDMFTSLIDMYGISNIASYFGVGTWGYWYGDLALPGSLPWSHQEIFVRKSPLYNADKVKTPLLIMHGEADNNVPPGESDQMFIALKILGKEVSYVRFADENHNIIKKFENLIEHREMMLEWFDKYLKDQPEGWEKRWEKK